MKIYTRDINQNIKMKIKEAKKIVRGPRMEACHKK